MIKSRNFGQKSKFNQTCNFELSKRIWMDLGIKLSKLRISVAFWEWIYWITARAFYAKLFTKHGWNRSSCQVRVIKPSDLKALNFRKFYRIAQIFGNFQKIFYNSASDNESSCSVIEMTKLGLQQKSPELKIACRGFYAVVKCDFWPKNSKNHILPQLISAVNDELF